MDRDPFRSIEQQFEQLQQQFEEALNMWSGNQFDIPEFDMVGSSMGIDLIDRDEEFVLMADLPGFDTDDITLRLSNNTLHLTAEHEEEKQDEDDSYIKSERKARTLRRSVQLPESIDDENIDATHKNGVLTVRLPKEDPSELDGKQIDIQG